MKRPNRQFFLAALCLVLLLASCKTSKMATIEVEGGHKITAQAENITIHSPDFQWMEAKFNAEIIDQGKPNSVSGKIRIRKDSLTWVTVRGAGIIEVARLLASPDSLQFIYYLDQKYFTGDYGFIRDKIKYNVNFTLLNSIFTGSPYFLMPQNTYEVSVSGNDTVLSTSSLEEYARLRKSSERMNVFFQAVWIGPNHQVNRTIVYDPSNKVELEIKYSDFKEVSGQVFPHAIEAVILGDTTNTVFKVNYTGIDLNLPVTFPFNIPKSYTPIQ